MGWGGGAGQGPQVLLKLILTFVLYSDLFKKVVYTNNVSGDTFPVSEKKKIQLFPKGHLALHDSENHTALASIRKHYYP